MSRVVLIILAVIGYFASRTLSKQALFFRKDYTYVKEFDAFYKLHTFQYGGNFFNFALDVCSEEGANLFYPSKKDEWKVVKELSKNNGEFEILVGFHDMFQVGEFLTVDGETTDATLNFNKITNDTESNIMMNTKTGTFRSQEWTPAHVFSYFVCKRIDDQSCPTIDSGYKYVRSVNKCYKIHKRARVWSDAVKTCYHEGGSLTSLDSKYEILDLLQQGTRYFVGFRSLGKNFYTVKGKLFENVDFERWWEQTNHNRPEYCGILEKGNSNDVSVSADSCDEKMPFICEMSVN